ncbi:cysteine--tRNA ligase [Hymenobacter jeollabukensis]|uniref:Cysteine--tRNA ligase n=1 Tax=Hymenobacter jeollabukensis TaxID=2025313 RepID=A0A5R8WSZ3_9BACT|nr:cysteine--tRNA ligase [Hymenobacter jeollabukensis]TLM94303.1 cysteine--tRNA ligase [Hymenobacter jeollabukensis]
MQHPLSLHNTLTRKKEPFVPVHAPFVGVYLCGPTVYSEAHVGNARGPVVFDVLTRYLRQLGYSVRYVRNITDVGHLVGDADEGEDKISKMARAQKLEPMQVAQDYANRYRRHMEALGCLSPDIEPLATGHIIEQIQMIEEIIENGFAYEVNGSVYFDVPRYNEAGNGYGKLSGRVPEELLSGSRDNLAGQDEKRSPLDFALWKKADERHLMRWPSPWGEGFPGWHLECSAMSRKYLGRESDIHGGGLDLMFPHHECEIAQSQASHSHTDEARVWLHNNMITVNGQKMSKSFGNFITISELFSGQHPSLSQAYSPMVVRFFLLQAHYRSTVDFSDEGLKAASKGYRKLMNGLRQIERLSLPEGTERAADTSAADAELRKLVQDCYVGLNDDLNTARAIASLFNLLRKFNGYYNQPATLAQVGEAALAEATAAYRTLVVDILGLRDEPRANAEELLGLTLQFYAEAKSAKDYAKVDTIRAALKEQGILVKDTKAGVDWAYEE